jgi:hypothetical protein
VAHDAKADRGIVVLGTPCSRDIESSPMGALTAWDEAIQKYCTTAWFNVHHHEKFCVRFERPSDAPSPLACVGEGSAFPHFRGPATLDEGVNLERFVNRKGSWKEHSIRPRAAMSEIYVNADTKTPYFVAGGGHGSFFSGIFANGTASVEEGTFALPSYCGDARLLAEDEPLPAALAPSVDLADAILGLNQG